MWDSHVGVLLFSNCWLFYFTFPQLFILYASSLLFFVLTNYKIIKIEMEDVIRKAEYLMVFFPSPYPAGCCRPGPEVRLNPCMASRAPVQCSPAVHQHHDKPNPATHSAVAIYLSPWWQEAPGPWLCCHGDPVARISQSVALVIT